MRIKICNSLFLWMLCGLNSPVFADSQHAATTFHAVKAELIVGQTDSAPSQALQLDAWWGSDTNKIWLKSEVERQAGQTERQEWWALYSRNISDFWDVQAGLRYDASSEQQTDHNQYVVLGLHGLAPYFIETDAHVFWQEPDKFGARLNLETTLQLSQAWQLRPELRLDLNGQNHADTLQGAGLSQSEWGAQLRYATRREFVPFVEFKQQRLWGNTREFAQQNGVAHNQMLYGLGVALLY